MPHSPQPPAFLSPTTHLDDEIRCFGAGWAKKFSKGVLRTQTFHLLPGYQAAEDARKYAQIGKRVPHIKGYLGALRGGQGASGTGR